MFRDAARLCGTRTFELFPRATSSAAARVDALAAHRAVRAQAALGSELAREAADVHAVASRGRSVDHLALRERSAGAGDAADAIDAGRVRAACVRGAERNRATVIHSARALVAEATGAALRVHRARRSAHARRADLAFSARSAAVSAGVTAGAVGAHLARGARDRHRAARDAAAVDALLSRTALEVELANLVWVAAAVADARLAHRALGARGAAAARFAAARGVVAHEPRPERRAVRVARAAWNAGVAVVAVLSCGTIRGHRAAARRGNALAESAIAHEAGIALGVRRTAGRRDVGVAASVARRSRTRPPHRAPSKNSSERSEKREVRNRGEPGHVLLPPERGQDVSRLCAAIPKSTDREP